MALERGARLGPYEIVAPLGAGGMGEVYRAIDMRLDREVALKVLPNSVAGDRERLARFEREAKVLAALNHPNIAQIYGLEGNALVMELVPGATLAVPQPLETALHYARQIAEALEAAHEKGITHRDLKPANIMVTPEGVVKVLDFGLASVPVRESAPDPANSPTLTMGATQAGVIMGTAAYMSPEQAAGKAVDKRSDVWSFGVVLYELLTGARLFDGESISHTLADVLRAPIDFSKLSPKAPAPIVELVQRCLERDPRKRLRDIGEARLAIEKYLADPAGPPPVAAAKGVSVLPWAIAAVALAVAVAVWYRAPKGAELQPLLRLNVDLGPDVSLASAGGAAAIISPDGTRLIFVSDGKLFTRKLDQAKSSALEGTEGAFRPFFSPDGKHVAFFAGGKLKRVSTDGGGPEVLCDAPLGLGGSWGEDGMIVASLTSHSILWQVPATGGEPKAITELGVGEIWQRWPQVLFNGKAVLFTVRTTAGFNIDVLSLKDRSRKTVVRGGSSGRYVATSPGSGHLLYVTNGPLLAVPFDIDALETRGRPAPVIEGISFNQNNDSPPLDVSGTGTLVYIDSETQGTGLVDVRWLDRNGKTAPLLPAPGNYMRPRLSPDGERLALEIADGSVSNIWIYDLRRQTMRRLTYFATGGPVLPPVWTADGRFILSQWNGGMFSIRSDGGGKPEPLTQSPNVQMPWSLTPDGKRLAFMSIESSAGMYDLWTMPLETDGAGFRGGKPEVFLQTAFDERHPMFSPDGHWVAYSSNELGRTQVFVRAFPDKGGKWQVSSAGGAYPVWSRNGRELHFRSPDSRIMVAAYQVRGDSFIADEPKVWSQKPLADFVAVSAASYDMAADGQRAVALVPVESSTVRPAQHHVVFLLNFFDELRRKSPWGSGR